MAKSDPIQFAKEVARIVTDSKAEDVVVLDLRSMSSVTDVVVICSGTSERQMRAAADHVVEYGKKVGQRPFGFCGYDTGAWIIVDFVDVVLHVFAKPYREYYDLELLWGDAPQVDWSRSESA
ncbi:MAG: ribosome silencing factor [Phycisphaerae bacterium]